MSAAELPPLPPKLDALRAHVLEHSVRRGQFTLKSGVPSSWFLDTKQTACRPDGILLVADAMLDVIPADATAIGGLTMGADPVAFGVAAVTSVPSRIVAVSRANPASVIHASVGPGSPLTSPIFR